jgi:hypothetical protein
MSLWGAYESDESKPKYLTAEEQKNCYATEAGWVYKHPNGDEEVLVAIGGLAGGTSASANLGEATINSIEFVTTSFSEAAGGDISVKVVYNEKVNVVTTGGTPTVTITNDQTGSGTDATFTAAYASGTGTNQLTFTATYGAADGGVAENDVLSIGAQSIALNSGTIKDATGAVNSGVAISAAQGTAAGTLTASA